MPNQFSNVKINGSSVSVIFPTTFTLPPGLSLNLISDHEIELDVTYTVKKWFFTVTRTSKLYWNADTGTFKVTI